MTTRKNASNWIWAAVTIAIIGALIAFLVVEGKKPGKYDTFTQCLSDSGAKFYGAFWCPHCQSQKALFGRSAKLLPYVECSETDGSGQLQVCMDEKVEGYPTWTFLDGTREGGQQTMEELSAKTNCPIE